MRRCVTFRPLAQRLGGPGEPRVAVCRRTRRSPPGTARAPRRRRASPRQRRPRSCRTRSSPPRRAPTRARSRRPGRRPATTCTFVRPGSADGSRAAARCAPASSGSPTTTACGFPTDTDVNSMPATSRAVDLTAPDLRLVRAVAEHARDDTVRGPTRIVRRSTGAVSQPRSGDARAVARHLGGRAVGVPDHDLDVVAVGRSTCRIPSVSRACSCTRRASAGRRQRRGRRSRVRASSTMSSAISPAGRSASTITMPGIRRIHFRW